MLKNRLNHGRLGPYILSYEDVYIQIEYIDDNQLVYYRHRTAEHESRDANFWRFLF